MRLILSKKPYTVRPVNFEGRNCPCQPQAKISTNASTCTQGCVQARPRI